MGSFFFTLIFPVIAIAGAAVQLARSPRPRTLGNASEGFLGWFLVGWAGMVGVLGILCYWIWGNFWLATVIATSVWLGGDAVVHIYHIVVNQNYHPGNAGLPFYFDILLPLLLIVLEIIYRVSGGRIRLSTSASRSVS